MEPGAHVLTVSNNGEVPIPAEALARWNTHQVFVVDLGDRIVMRPLSEDPVTETKGKYAGRGPSADAARAQERQATRGQRF